MLLLNPVLLVHLVQFVEQVAEPLFQSFVILLRQRFLVDPLEDLLLFVHESRQSLVLLHL